MDDKDKTPSPDQRYPNGDLFHYDIGPDQPMEAADDEDYDADGDSDEPDNPLDEQLPNLPGDPLYQTPTLNPNPIVDLPANSDEKLFV